MNETMNVPTSQRPRSSFTAGMAVGTILGAGLVMWLAPRGVQALRKRISDSAAELGKRASDQYQQSATRMAAAVDAIATSGQDARDDFADVVVRGAQEVERGAQHVERGAQHVERFATAAKSGR